MGGLQVLFVSDIRNGAFVAAFIGWREGILAAGDNVFRAYGQLTAPRSAPGQSQAQTFPFARLAGDVNHTADDVGAEGAVATANAETLGVPPVRHGGDI